MLSRVLWQRFDRAPNDCFFFNVCWEKQIYPQNFLLPKDGYIKSLIAIDKHITSDNSGSSLIDQTPVVVSLQKVNSINHWISWVSLILIHSA